MMEWVNCIWCRSALAKLGNSKEFHQFGSRRDASIRSIPALFINNPVNAILGPLLGPKKLCWTYFQDESIPYAVAANFQARLFLSHIITSLGDFDAPLLNMDKQFVRHRSPATKARIRNVVASLQILQPPPGASQFFTRVSLRWQWLRLSGRGVSLSTSSVSLTAPPPYQLTVWRHITLFHSAHLKGRLSLLERPLNDFFAFNTHCGISHQCLTVPCK